MQWKLKFALKNVKFNTNYQLYRSKHSYKISRKCLTVDDVKANDNLDRNNSNKVNPFDIYHIPVMMNECCDFLNIQPGGIYVDCTLGGGGHTRAILERGGKVIAFDQDPDAIKKSKVVLNNYILNGTCEIIQTNFRNIKNALITSELAKHNNGLVDGVLMDLGISSFQIDEASRGFAFSQDGPLDMRMNKGEMDSNNNDMISYTTESLSANDIINDWDANDLADVLYNYGDEVRSRVIAREIVSARPLSTTKQLDTVISRITPFKQRSKTLARCFQALRIVVNDELGALEEALETMHHCLKYKGRFVVMSYHSLEDRRIKTLFRDGTIEGKSLRNQLPSDSSNINSNNNENNHSNNNNNNKDDIIKQFNPWQTINKRAITPTEEELQNNRRSRSAKLRVAEQILLYRNNEIDEDINDEINSNNKMGAKQLAKLKRRILIKDNDEV